MENLVEGSGGEEATEAKVCEYSPKIGEDSVPFESFFVEDEELCEPERWDQVKRVDKSVLSVSSRDCVFLGLCGVIYMSIEPRVM